MARFRSKPVEIDAVQLTSAFIIEAYGGGAKFPPTIPPGLSFDGWADPVAEQFSGIFTCKSRQGEVVAEPDDWIIAEPGAPKLCYPCKPDVFSSRWEPVDD
jgi:hypothetical protein